MIEANYDEVEDRPARGYGMSDEKIMQLRAFRKAEYDAYEMSQPYVRQIALVDAIFGRPWMRINVKTGAVEHGTISTEEQKRWIMQLEEMIRLVREIAWREYNEKYATLGVK